MRMRGLEPPRPYGHTDLNRARLPIPPHPRGSNDSSSGASHSTMIRIPVLLAACLAVVLLATGGVTVAPAPVSAERTQVVVALRSPALALSPGSGKRIEAEQRAFRRELSAQVPEARVRWRYRLVENGFAVSLPAAQVPRLRSLPGVRDVFESARYGPQLDATPQQIGAPALWGPGLDTAGQGVKIGIIDTGVDPSHPFFDPSGYTMPAGFPKGQVRFTSAKVIVARAFAPPGARAPQARLGFDGQQSAHGTHVAGIAAGNPRTPAAGGRVVSGVAPRAYLGNYRALVRTDSGLSPNGNSPEIVAAIETAVRDGMNVLNLSIGEPEIEPSRDIVARALDAAAAAGVVPVVAAGNDFNDLGAGSVSSPANASRAIAVGAVEVVNRSGVHADFSSVGPTALSLRLKPDVAAPGVDVFSSVPNGWASFSGTSMATPHVAGAAALLRQRHPGWAVADIVSALAQSGSTVLDENGRPLGPQFQGGGLVSLPGADTPPFFAQPSAISFGLVTPGTSVRGSVRLADAGEAAGTWQVVETRTPGAPGGAALLLPPTVEVPGTLSYELAAPTDAPRGDVSGWLVLRREAAVRRIPFWGRVSVASLARHRTLPLVRPGTYRGTTRGRPALVTRYRYPENPRGIGVTTVLGGPELVYRFRLTKAAANFGVVVTRRAPGVRVEPRVVSGIDENRLTGYAGLPVHHNPYLDGFRSPVLAAGALSPRPGEYAIVFDSGTRAGAGSFDFRLWVNDVTPPLARLRARTVAAGGALLVGVTDAGSGVYPSSIRVRIDGDSTGHVLRNGVIRIPTAGLFAGRHRLEVRVSDYQETKNTENVRRILPNTRTLQTTFTVRR